ncbi:MAG: DUF481 domain-containing protein [Candidatus Sabulitectum sp.]|nr:DUF481 domain-containing protein [Candidatus Sabulitectum sp.]
MKLVIILCSIAVVSAFSMETSVTLGGLLTSGNSRISQTDAGFEISGTPATAFETGLVLIASYGKQEETTYRESYFSEGSLKYSITEHNYTAARAYWTMDKISGINHEYGASAGLGRELISGGSFTATLEAGAGYLSRENTEDVILETSTWYTGTDLEWQISDSWTAVESAIFTGDLQDSENYYIGSVLEARSAITGSLSFVMGYDVTYYSIPPVEGNENTDTALRLQLRFDL